MKINLDIQVKLPQLDYVKASAQELNRLADDMLDWRSPCEPFRKGSGIQGSYLIFDSDFEGGLSKLLGLIVFLGKEVTVSFKNSRILCSNFQALYDVLKQIESLDKLQIRISHQEEEDNDEVTF